VICADSSVWIHALREGTGAVALHLAELLEGDALALPVPVKLEILSGTPRRAQADVIDGFTGMATLTPSPVTWDTMESWIGTAVAAGQRFAVLDLLIAAIAREHQAQLWTLDADFGRMAKLGFVELYAAP
jgi:predicted nucleic acid-binding protein